MGGSVGVQVVCRRACPTERDSPSVVGLELGLANQPTHARPDEAHSNASESHGLTCSKVAVGGIGARVEVREGAL
jgi:hypothetical protein